jgi:hypothetical protein
MKITLAAMLPRHVAVAFGDCRRREGLIECDETIRRADH